MARYRMVERGFWTHPDVEDMGVGCKLLYLYLTTSAYDNNLGVIERSRRKIAFETGLTEQEIDEYLGTLERMKKVVIDGRVIFVRNFIKHQAAISPNIIKGLQEDFHSLSSNKITAALLREYPDCFNGLKPFVEKTEPLTRGLQGANKGLVEQKQPLPEFEYEYEDEYEDEGNDEAGTLELKAESSVFSAASFKKLWNEELPKSGYPFPSWRELTTSQQGEFNARQKAYKSDGATEKQFWLEVIDTLRRSPWLRGETGTGKYKNWIAKPNFVLTAKGLQNVQNERIKLESGGKCNYDDDPSNYVYIPVDDDGNPITTKKQEES